MSIFKKITAFTLIFLFFVSVSTNIAFAGPEPISKITVKEYVVKHSLELGIDPALGLSIAKLESGFCHEKKSPGGAVGVFQLMPRTAQALGYNPWYLSENIKGGLVYYNMMYKKFGSIELALAAYNAGPANVSRYKGMPPFPETRYFVRNIMDEYNKQKSNPDPVINKVKQDNIPKAASSSIKPAFKEEQSKSVNTLTMPPKQEAVKEVVVKEPVKEVVLNVNNVESANNVEKTMPVPATMNVPVEKSIIEKTQSDNEPKMNLEEVLGTNPSVQAI